ncbi:MAG TPA: hypothetical protein VJ938_06670, partial [Acidimicrobiia bacterium]|nr:hypothetical protein [Acidimicrobiia bacterium]
MARDGTTESVGSRWSRFPIPAAMLVTAFLLSALPAFAQDTTSVAVSPDEGPPSTSVVVSGEGWFVTSVEPGDPGEAVDPSDIIATFRNETWTPTLAVDDNGSLTGDGTIPAGAFGGVAQIEFCADGVECATTFFTVTPTIFLSQEVGPPGTTIQVTGSGFEPVDPPRQWDVRLGDDQEPIGFSLVGSEGTLEGSGTVPFSASEGATRISVCQFDVDLGDVCYSAPFEVTAPDLSVDPSELQPGEALTFTGSGWCCDGATGAVFAGDPAQPWGSVEVDEVGNLTGQATVPAEQPAGPVDVSVCIAEGCRQVGITILPPAATTISTPATTTEPTTSTVPSTTTTADPAEALCELEPG